jgi:hypothetical protein
LLFETGRHFSLPLDQSEDRGYRSGSTAYREKRAIGKENLEEFECGVSDRWLAADRVPLPLKPVLGLYVT